MEAVAEQINSVFDDYKFTKNKEFYTYIQHKFHVAEHSHAHYVCTEA